MQPTPEAAPTPAGAPPVVGESLVEFVRADRQRAAFILMGVAALLLAVCGWAAWTASKTPAAPEKKEESPLQVEEPAVKNPHRSDYIVGALLAGLGTLSAVGVGGWLLVSLPPVEPARQRTEARAAILAAGGLLGAVLILAGVAYFYLWSSSLFDWLDKGQVKQAKYVIGPLLAIAVGGLLMFLAIQPARAEERQNYVLRRLVYGANFGLSVLLVFVALVVLNVIVSPRLPNRLDTTASNFYSLSEGSREFLTKLPEPVTAYAILQEGRRDSDDIRRLLQNAADASGGKFTLRSISPVADQNEYRQLAGRYPTLETNDFGVLVTVGEDQKRHSFIREDEFFQREQGAMRGEGGRLFVGEGRLMRELQYLEENEQKAVVYFTQSAGELDIAGGQQSGPMGSALRLKEYLTRNYLEVKPLKFDLKEPKVPDDASVVVVAEPERPLEDPHVAAIRKYMTEPRGAKKGKLIVLAGASFGPQPKSEVLRTGLEGLLKEFNVNLEQRLVIGAGTREMDPYTAIAGFAEAARRARNPVAIALGPKAQFLSVFWREAAPAQGGPAFRAVPLLYTVPPGRFTWLEDHLPPSRELNQIINELNNNPAVRRAKQFSDDPRPVGVAVSEGEAGRLVVVGNGIFVSDGYAQQAGGEPPGFDLVGGSIDWLRDRPPLTVQVENKKYVEFKFPATTDENRGLFLPLLLSVAVVAGLGVGVWMVRRGAA